MHVILQQTILMIMKTCLTWQVVRMRRHLGACGVAVGIRLAELRELKGLLDCGALSGDEFQPLKARLLNGD